MNKYNSIEAAGYAILLFITGCGGRTYLELDSETAAGAGGSVQTGGAFATGGRTATFRSVETGGVIATGGTTGTRPQTSTTTEPTVTAIAVGDYHTCAVYDGATWCWGSNNSGALGNGSAIDSRVLFPSRVMNIGPATTLDGGRAHTCAVIEGAAYCWGDNAHGELGNNSTNSALTPNQVNGLSASVTAISAGDAHTCAVVGGLAYCWGSNGNNRLGPTSWDVANVPRRVEGLNDVTGVTAGHTHSCAVAEGNAYCWGYDSYGALGNRSPYSSSTPIQVAGLTGRIASIAAGGHHTCALLMEGTVMCWGYNLYGQLGDGTTKDSRVPVQVLGLGVATGLAAGFGHTCALVDGGVRCWGSNARGQLGSGSIGTDSNDPTEVGGLSAGVTAVAAGHVHTCAVADGKMFCWGSNDFGQLGTGTTNSSYDPQTVTIR